MAAVLLMSIAPTVSRLLLSVVSPHQPILMELCTTAGLKLIDVSSPNPNEESGTPAHATTDNACGYCVLATPLPLLLLVIAILASWPPVGRHLCRYQVFLPSPRNMRGIGSQGPPLAL